MHLVLAALSVGAAAIHLAAGPAHVEAMGDLGLGFYWAALFQLGIAIGCLRAGATGPGPWLRRFALAGMVAITAAWLVSRTVGLPLVPGGAEPIGTADLVATILQLGTILGLVAWAPGRATPTDTRRPPRVRRSLAGSALVGVLAVIVLSSSIAVVDAAAGHGHGPGVAADHLEDGPGPDDQSGLSSDHGHGAPIGP